MADEQGAQPEGAIRQADQCQFEQPGNLAIPQAIPVEVSGGTFQTARFGPTHTTESRDVGIAGGNFTGAHIGPRYNFISAASVSNRGTGQSRPVCTKHPGMVCSPLTDSICLFQKKKLSTAPKTKVYAGAKTSGVLPDELLAIKLIQGYTDKNAREAKNLVKLRPHQNVVTILQADDCPQAPVKTMFIAMERCQTMNLESYIEIRKKLNVPFNMKQAFEYSKQIIEGIRHIHQSGILHRDLKPCSVLFPLRGNSLKICDFGLSKELQNGHSVMSLSQLKLGTDGYRAPETYNKNEITKMVDIFSLGLVLHHLMSYGFHPFGLDTEEWNFNIKKYQNLNLSRLRVPFREAAKEFFSNMFKFRPKDRPTIDEVMTAFLKLDWLTPLMRDLVQIWTGIIKDDTGADVFPCQLYCSPNVREVVGITGMDWNLTMNTVNFLNIGALKKVTDEDPSGYIVTSSKDEVKKLTDKLANNKLLAWIAISKEGKDEKILVLLSYKDVPELFGFFFPTRKVVSSVLGKLVSKRREPAVGAQQPSLGSLSSPLNAPMRARGPSHSFQIEGASGYGPSVTGLEEPEPSIDSSAESRQSTSSRSPPQLEITTNKEFIPWWIISEE